MFLKMYNNDALWVYVEDGWSLRRASGLGEAVHLLHIE